MFEDPVVVRLLVGHNKGITSLAFSADDKFVVSSGLDSTVILWKLKQKGLSLRFTGHSDSVYDVSVSSKNDLIASASRDKTIRLWVPKIKGNSNFFKGHTSAVRSVEFSSDGCFLLSASNDKTVKVWEVNRQKFLASLSGHSNWVRCAVFEPHNGDVVGSCSDDKTVRLWDTRAGKVLHKWNVLNGYVAHLAFHPSGKYIALGLTNGVVKLMDLRTHSLLQQYCESNDTITKLSFHPSGKFLLVSSRDSAIKALDLVEGRTIYTLGCHTGAVTCVSFSSGGNYFTTGGDDNKVFLWKSCDSDSDDSENKRHDCKSKTAKNKENEVISVRDKFDVRNNKKKQVTSSVIDKRKHNVNSETNGFVAANKVEEAESLKDNPIEKREAASIEKNRVADAVTLKDIYKVVTRLDQRIERTEESLKQSVEVLQKRIQLLEDEMCTKLSDTWPSKPVVKKQLLSNISPSLGKGQENRKKLGEHQRLRIGTLNILTLTGKMEEVVDVMRETKLDVLGLSETKWMGRGEKELRGGYKVFWSGNVRAKKNGVAFVTSKRKTTWEVERWNPERGGE